MKFGFVAKHRGVWPVGLMCEALGISRSSLFAWLDRLRSQRARENEVLGAQIGQVSWIVTARTARGARSMTCLPWARAAGCIASSNSCARALRARPRSLKDRRPPLQLAPWSFVPAGLVGPSYAQPFITRSGLGRRKSIRLGAFTAACSPTYANAPDSVGPDDGVLAPRAPCSPGSKPSFQHRAESRTA